MNRKVVKVYKDEVSEEKWLKMEVIKEGEGRRMKKVDYKKLVKELDGKLISVRGLERLMMKCSDGKKKKVYYSEVLRMLKSLKNSGKIVFERRSGEVIYYSIKSVK